VPWSDKQVRLFAAAAHNPEIASRTGIPQHKAREMEMEASPEQRSHAMKGGPMLQRAMAKRLRKGKA
jgi:hypothetical protein